MKCIKHLGIAFLFVFIFTMAFMVNVQETEAGLCPCCDYQPPGCSEGSGWWNKYANRCSCVPPIIDPPDCDYICPLCA